MDRWSIIRQRAAEVVAEYQSRTGRLVFSESAGSFTQLSEIANEIFGLTVAPDDTLPANVYGQLDLDEGTICYRPDQELGRQHFTIAHELGHAALRHPARQIADTADDIDEQPGIGTLSVRDGVFRAYNDRDRWELEANIFAAELLMPIEHVRTLVSSDPDWTITRLIGYFAVSRAAMRNQLAAALLPGPLPPASATSHTRSEMDPSQRKAAEAEGATLVLAGPGAGKTLVLTERFRYLVEKCGVPANRILALTFGNTAAEEMRERLAALLPDEAHAIDVNTFHALGLQLLQDYGPYLGLQPNPKLLTEIDAFVLLHRRLGEVPLGTFADLYHPARPIRMLLQTISRAKDELVDPEEFARQAKAWDRELAVRREPASEAEILALAEERDRARACLDVAAVYRTYQAWLRADGYLDYGDLIVETIRLLNLPDIARDIRGRWDHILVDEFQDINFASGQLVRALDGGRGIVWAVGDPRQSIYRFRGASPVNLRDFTTHYPGATIIPLEWNYRSVEGIVRAGQAIDIPLPPGASGVPLPMASLRARRERRGNEPAVEVITAATGGDERDALGRVLS